VWLMLIVPPPLSMLVEELDHKWRPLWNGVRRIDEEVPFGAKWRHQVIFGTTAGRGVRLVHPLGQIWPEVGVVFDIEPQHRHARRAPERSGRVDQLVRRAIVVRLAADVAAAPSRQKG